MKPIIFLCCSSLICVLQPSIYLSYVSTKYSKLLYEICLKREGVGKSNVQNFNVQTFLKVLQSVSGITCCVQLLTSRVIFINRQCSECDPSSDDEGMEVDPQDTTPISQGRQRRVIKEPTKFTPDKGEVRQKIQRVMKICLQMSVLFSVATVVQIMK